MTTSESAAPGTSSPSPEDDHALTRVRREKLERWRGDLGISGYGHRVDGLSPLEEARAAFSEAHHTAFDQLQAAAKETGTAVDPAADPRQRVIVAGRCVQHRAMGGLVFVVIRDHTGDLQISIAKSGIDRAIFKMAEKLDYGDIVVAEGPIGRTSRGEVCVWAERFELHCKSLATPPEKWHGVTDPEIRYRRRPVDMYATDGVMRTFLLRSRILARMRRFMEERGFAEVETPMMQAIAGGAAARPFVTHHNALGIPLFMRIAPELYHKRLLVGGMPRVFEIGRNFRNEGIDRSHNPEFTAMEAYQAFGDCETMLELTESLLHELACMVAPDSDNVTLPYGDLTIDWSRPFARIEYADLFQQTLHCDLRDEDAVRRVAEARGRDDARTLDHWLLVDALFEDACEETIDPKRPTFVTGYPSATSPLTRPDADRPWRCGRWDILIGGMEVGTAYTELNDPDEQYRRFTQQLAGAGEEEAAIRTLDEDFLAALRVGMPPAGGLGLGVDRIVMLMTNQTSIRDVILFPLMRPLGSAEPQE